MNTNDVSTLSGATVRSTDGHKIGTVAQVYLDDQTGRPQWVTVKTGLFGTKESFVPLAAARVEGDDLVVDADKDTVSGAPRVEGDDHISEQEEAEIYRYYGLADSDSDSGTADALPAQPVRADNGVSADGGVNGGRRPAGHDTSGPDTDDAMTRSEERLVAGTEQVDAGRARLRKYVVTSTETVQVPVSHEEVRLEREPITEANRGAAYSGADITEEEHEVTLRAERPVVGTTTEAVERVRLSKETVTDTETVSGEVRKEEIEFDDESGTAPRR